MSVAFEKRWSVLSRMDKASTKPQLITSLNNIKDLRALCYHLAQAYFATEGKLQGMP